MRYVLAAIALAALGGCLARPPYGGCRTADDCAAAGAGAQCEPEHACSLPDPTCPGGHRYWGPAAPGAGDCVPVRSPDAAIEGELDASSGAEPLPPTSVDRECVPGGRRTADTTCASKVCTAEPACCDRQWDALCVRQAQTLCQARCASMLFVGGYHGTVVRTDTWAQIWDDGGGDGYTMGGYWGDFDGDGDADLATVGKDMLRVWRNDGMDGPALALREQWSKAWSQLADNASFGGHAGGWADLDGDGDLDLAFGGDKGLVVLRNVDGAFGEPQRLLAAPADGAVDAGLDDAGVWALAWTDVDDDGDPDLIAGRAFASALLFRNDGTGALAQDAWTGPSYVRGVQACNLDGDRARELVFSGNSFVKAVDIVAGTPQVGGWIALASDFYAETACGDLDHDGDLDLFAAPWGAFPARAFRNDDGTLPGLSGAWREDTADGHLRWGVDLGDLDGDGDLDAVTAGDTFDQPTTIVRYRNDSDAQHVLLAPEAPVTRDGSIYDIELGPLPVAAQTR